MQEWKHQLRSALHPVLIAGLYYVTAAAGWIFGLSYKFRADALILAPRLFHGTCTAVTDYAIWRLAARIFGEEAAESTAAVRLTTGVIEALR